MYKFTRYSLSLLLLTSSLGADAGNDSSTEEHRVPRVSGRIVKVYSGNRPEPYLCNSEGYKLDPHSCASFYRCVKEKNGKFNVFRYQCAPGTVYDPELETCNHPRSTRRTECGGVMMKPTVGTIDSTLVNEIEPQKELPRPIKTDVLALVKETSVKESTVTHKESPWVTSQSISTGSPLKTMLYLSPSTPPAYFEDTNKYNPGYNNVESTNLPWMSDKVEDDWSKTSSLPKITTNSKNTVICSDDGFTGDTENCRKFYRCVGNQRGGFLRYEFFCSEPTVWDEEIQSCNHPWAVKRSKCGRRMSFTDISETMKPTSTEEISTTQEPTSSTAEYRQKTNKTIQQQLQISHGSTVTQTQTQISSSDQTIQNQTQINYGDRITQNKDTKTKQNQTQISFSSAVSQTQTQIDYGDKGMQTQVQIDHSKNSSQSQTQIHESTTSQTTTSIQNSSPNNNNQCSENGFMGDSNDCKKFYRCVDSGKGTLTKYEYLCGDGTVWDQSIEACNHAGAVKECGGQSHSETISSSTVKPTTSYADTTTSTQSANQSTSEAYAPEIDDIDVGYGNEVQPTTLSSMTSTKTTTIREPQNVPNNHNECISSGFMGDASNCKKFYRCVENRMGEYTRYEFTCGEESHTNNVCTQSGFMGDHRDCKKFYRCVDNGDETYTRYDFICGEGTLWDSKIEACNHEWAVETCSGSTESTTPVYSSSSQHPTLHDEIEENESTTQNQESISTTQRSTTTVGSETTPNQYCTNSGFVGDANDCKKFYRCVDNGNGGYDRYQFSCGEGTVWDKSILACNHAWAVKECGASSSATTQISNESTSENTVISTEVDHQEPTRHTTEKSESTTRNPSENEVNDGDCEKEGFFGSLIDCKKFYRCVDDGNGGFTKYEFNCGEGTTWNQKIEACDHPSQDRPCGQDYQSTTKESHINDEMITETTTKITSSTASIDKEDSQETQKPQSSSGACKSEGFNADTTDCKKFYRCVDDGKGGYTKYNFTCGAGTVWNQEILACDHESDDKSCLSIGSGPTEGSGSQSESTTNVPLSEITTPTFSSTTASNQGTDKTDPPASIPSDKCTSEGFFAHPHDCKKFVRCVSNGDGGHTRYEFSCGEGTVWVQEIQTCDHDNGKTSCSVQNESNTKPDDHGSSSTTESGSTSSTETHTAIKEDDEYPTTKQPSNTDKCTSEGYFANKNDCRKFYRCVANGDGGYTKHDFVCGEGTAWDSNVDTCNHINDVASCSEISKEESHTQEPMRDEEVTETTEGMSSTTKGTTSSSESSEVSESGSGSNDNCKSEGYYGNSKDCRKFYRCVDDGKGGLTKYDFTCGEGTIWDQDITNCNHPQDVTNPSCVSGGEGEHSQTSSTSSTTSSTTSSPESTSLSSGTSESSSQSSSNCSQEESSTKPASSKDISCEKAGYYTNPNDCKKFYRCVDWDGDGKRFSVYHFECGEGTIWDPALDTCNHEESVYPPRDCSQTQAQTESSSEGVTTTKHEETTTQETTTSEQTTTQEPTTSDQITTEKEKTTTQESTTSKQTTTQLSTTSEETTTQQSTTSEQTTTQQSTTSEQTTTQQSTTSEQSTTQQTTTSEQTTSEQPITQKPTTSEQTTTQQSTTSELTTTQQSTTSVQTTQESTTSEQTTQEPMTSEQTTQESTTSEQITQEPTSEQTTEQTTTQESITSEQSTTAQTSEQTESSTIESATESTTSQETGSTTEQSSTTTEGEQESTTQSSPPGKECPDTEDDQYLYVCPTSFRRHPKYCNMFYQCTEDDDTHEVKIATFKCPNNTIYDESKTQCVDEKKADKKCDGEIMRRHRFQRLNRDSKEPITVDEENKSCPSVGYYAFEKNIECSNGFLKCEKSKSGTLRGYVHQCPEGYLFWTISKRCELAENIRDCKRSGNDWKARWNIPVDRKNVAF
ncbi:Uncharacterized protein OBRU01_10251 [Operophtera brumata]|uniref:Chitin-binding type-2 domain-containing protein n=1 Tax=Operophtera brumata TaxID=104452 RepID=A0A0L7L3H9_OPEBR|nr:Uncharacterized protein OBRU01_10251 [Operophtera brumata]